MQLLIFFQLSLSVLFVLYISQSQCQDTKAKNNGDVLTVVGTVDGKIHGINQNLEKVWSLSTGGPMVTTQNHNSFDVGTETYEEHENNDKFRDSNKDYSIFTSIDGSIMYQTHDGMRKTSVTARFLTEQAPFVSKEGLIFTGKKSSKIIGFDLNNGKILYDYSNNDKFRSALVAPNGLRKLPMMNINSVTAMNPFWMGRVDYSLRAVDSITGREQFNLTYSELHPLLSESAVTSVLDEDDSVDSDDTTSTFAITNTAALESNSAISSYHSAPKSMSYGNKAGDMELISTPSGDLYFVDENGNFIEKVPISLESPVINAFKFKKKSSQENLSLDLNKKFDVGKININYRMISTTSDYSQLDTATKSSEYPLVPNTLQTAFDPTTEEQHGEEMMFVQPSSLLLTGHEEEEESLYVIPVTKISIPDFPVKATVPLDIDKVLSEFLSDETDTEWVANGESDSNSDSGTINPISRNRGIGASMHNPTTSAIVAKHSQGPFKTLKNLQHLKDLNSIQPNNNLPISKLIQKGKSVKIGSEQVSSERWDKISNSRSSCIIPSPLFYYSLKEHEVCNVCIVNSQIEPCENDGSIMRNSVRGPHKLRDELYDGHLFSPHQISTLFKGVLSSSHDKDSDLQRIERELYYNSITKKNSKPNVKKYQAKEIFYQRIIQVFELLVLYVFTAVLLIVILLLIGVYCVRSSIQYSHLLPTNATFLQQMLYVLNKVVQNAFINIIKKNSSSDSLSSNNLKQTKSSESFDKDGRKLLHIGSMIVNVEEILGYGSHGTIVYKGSLNGRPLAVKRILSQFTKEADREISLLIKSDGHLNVVRYFLKEERRDFVYLGLQLCEMSLKDLVIKIKQNLDLNNEGVVNQEMFSDEVRTSLLQIAQGLAHLHSQKIVHRDIKPHNILCANPNESSSSNIIDESNSMTEKQLVVPGSSFSSLNQLSNYILKISDMGLSKQLDRDENSFSSMSFSMPITSLNKHSYNISASNANDSLNDKQRALVMMQNQAAVGTVGWQAPELISHRYQCKIQPINDLPTIDDKEIFNESDDEDNENISNKENIQSDIVIPIDSDLRKQRRDRKKRTLTVDIFSLGCVFFYVLTIGDHPFGEWFERELNIVSGNMKLTGLEQDPIAQDLITWMLDADPLKRPTSKEVCEHIFFWSYSKRLEFLVEFSDRLEQESADSAIMFSVEANNNIPSSSIIGSRWDHRLDPLLLEDMGKYRKYDTSSVRDLLRVIRNKRHHFHELSSDLKANIGSLPNGFYNYFSTRFPNLLLHCVEISNRYLSSERTFKAFSGSISIRWRRRKLDLTTVDRNIQNSTISNNNIDEDKQHLAITQDNSSNIGSTYDAHNNKSKNLTHDDLSRYDQLLNENNLNDVIILRGSNLESSLKCNGWWRNYTDWVEGIGIVNNTNNTTSSSSNKKTVRASHLMKSATDLKYRTRLCSHWEMTSGGNCPMRKKGKCIFAHGPLELRVKETRRDKWGVIHSVTRNNNSINDNNHSNNLLRASGGEDVLGAARLADKPGSNTTNGSISTNPNTNNASNRSQFQPNPFMMFPPNMYYSNGHTVYYQSYQPVTQPVSTNNNNCSNSNDNNTN